MSGKTDANAPPVELKSCAITANESGAPEASNIAS